MGITDSSSTNAVNNSSARTMKRLQSSQCAPCGDYPGSRKVQRNATAIMNVARVIAAPFMSLCHRRVKCKRGRIQRVKYWEIIANNVRKRGWSLGWGISD